MPSFSIRDWGSAVGNFRVTCGLADRFSIGTFDRFLGMLKTQGFFTRFFRLLSRWFSTPIFAFSSLLGAGFYPSSTGPINIMTKYKLITFIN